MASLTVPLQKESILNLREFYGCGAGFVVVRHVIDSSADRIGVCYKSEFTCASANQDTKFGRLTTGLSMPHPRWANASGRTDGARKNSLDLGSERHIHVHRRR